MSDLILVLDGFGIGAMPDAGTLRPDDVAADTLGSLVKWCRLERGAELKIPNLAALGLANLRPELGLNTAGSELPATNVVARRAALGYPGADTYAGHQTMMGADMSQVLLCNLGARLPAVQTALATAGFKTVLWDDQPMILAYRPGNPAPILVHDNLESDPGLNWNVSARLSEVPWEDILAAAMAVRSVSPVARVIAVGGYSDGPLLNSVRFGDSGVVGLDTPASGFYRNPGLQVQHLGVPIDHTQQLPERAAEAGLPVTLIGKAADILATDTPVARIPGVETTELLAEICAASAAAKNTKGLMVANVQQTDLAGHQKAPARFAAVLEEVDQALPQLVANLGANDLLVITADHGNDPLIGHAYHTREFVPVLEVTRVAPGATTVTIGPDLASLAEVGDLVATHLGLNLP